jgi:hypothetical protein
MMIAVEISSLSPLLMSRFHEAAEASVNGTSSPVMNGRRLPPREAAERSAYRTDKGDLYLPAANLLSAIVQAGQFTKVGRKQLTTAKSSIVPAAVGLSPPELMFGTRTFEVDSRPVVMAAAGGARVMRHRARLDEWKLRFDLLLDETMIAPEAARQLVDDAGRKIGIGDFRPARRGPFGRFVVTGWKERRA